jgi:hypothetical protein
VSTALVTTNRCMRGPRVSTALVTTNRCVRGPSSGDYKQVREGSKSEHSSGDYKQVHEGSKSEHCSSTGLYHHSMLWWVEAHACVETNCSLVIYFLISHLLPVSLT